MEAVDPGRFDPDYFSFIKNGVYSAFRMVCYVRAYRLRTYVHSKKAKSPIYEITGPKRGETH